MEEYLQRWGGEDAKEDVEEAALAFFQKAGPGRGPELRVQALRKSCKLQQRLATAQKRATMRHDALLLLEQVADVADDEHDANFLGDDHEESDSSKLDARLVSFKQLVQDAGLDAEGGEDEPPEPSLREVMAEVKALREQVAALAWA